MDPKSKSKFLNVMELTDHPHLISLHSTTLVQAANSRPKISEYASEHAPKSPSPLEGRGHGSDKPCIRTVFQVQLAYRPTPQ